MRPAIVVWGDAWEEQGDQDITNWKHTELVTHSCGWVFMDDEEGISMCSEWWPTEKGRARHPTFIPRGMIISVQYLK